MSDRRDRRRNPSRRSARDVAHDHERRDHADRDVERAAEQRIVVDGEIDHQPRQRDRPARKRFRQHIAEQGLGAEREHDQDQRQAVTLRLASNTRSTIAVEIKTRTKDGRPFLDQIGVTNGYVENKWRARAPPDEIGGPRELSSRRRESLTTASSPTSRRTTERSGT